jgi:hypothetical protein
MPAPPELAETPVAEPAPAPAEEVHEVDLSDEWASVLEHQPAPAPPEPSRAAHSPAPAEFEVPAAEAQQVDEFSISEEPVASVAGEVPAAEEIDLTEMVSAAPAEKASSSAPPKPAKPVEPEPEFEVEQDYDLVIEPEPLVPAHDQRPPEKPVVPLPEPEPVAQDAAAGKPNGAFQSDQFLADLANEIDQLGLGELTPSVSEPANSHAPAPSKPAAPVAATPTGPLKEVFEEFRAELGEMGAEDEDLETHYNLGIAFREMGLLEEAISEFQKVAKATDNGRAFRYSMQCCTLLGLAFMEKGQPGIAAIWYERALKTPGIDPESVLALRYDLGVAQESAGDPAAALKSFSQVYAMNIDYRDVAERIAALQKPAR